MDDSTEYLARTQVCDGRGLTYKEIKRGWGSAENFFHSYGLKPWNPEDCDEMRQISRSLKEDNRRNN